jgi:hypothetical protein
VPFVAVTVLRAVQAAPGPVTVAVSRSPARTVNTRACAGGAGGAAAGPVVAAPAYPVERAARVAHGPSPDTSRTCTAIAVTGPFGAA